ncbi:MAG: DUF993 family protein [Planctomycetota bacterium]|nr:DUF993 family protein [Planctomycetota bacterium]
MRVELGDGRSLHLDDEVLVPHRQALAATAEPEPVRMAFAAAHLVMVPSYHFCEHSSESPGSSDEIAVCVDWQASMELRRNLDALGFGVAEAMDTAQRFEIGWTTAERLIRECGALGLDNGFIAGAGTDHLEQIASRDELVEGVVYQAEVIGDAGGTVIILPMPWLVQEGFDADGYVEIYEEIFSRLQGPLLVHWLGEMFAPALQGYFPGDSFSRVMALAPEKVRGAKLSLLDAAMERQLRSELAERGQIMLTGDDLNFCELIAGPPPENWQEWGGHRIAIGDFSHALLGIFDGVAEPASLALRWLARGDLDRYFELMRPAQELSRLVFESPTRHYKAGLAFLSWLNDRQENFMLVNRQDQSRNFDHFVRLTELASAAGVLRDAEVAAERLRMLSP